MSESFLLIFSPQTHMSHMSFHQQRPTPVPLPIPLLPSTTTSSFASIRLLRHRGEPADWAGWGMRTKHVHIFNQQQILIKHTISSLWKCVYNMKMKEKKNDMCYALVCQQSYVYERRMEKHWEKNVFNGIRRKRRRNMGHRCWFRKSDCSDDIMSSLRHLSFSSLNWWSAPLSESSNNVLQEWPFSYN